MGKLTSQPEHAIHHFSHPHPLQLSNYQTPNAALCSGCKLRASGWIYSCKYCNYLLHISCSKLPQQITHPFDHQNHVLSLLPKPAYSEGLFNCDACGKQGNGFAYHCGTCNIDLHTICATMPLLLTHQSHPHHLNLTFSVPYHNKGFSCDICKNMGSNEWLYRCNMCEFDAHLVCATKAPIQPNPYSHIPATHYAQAPPLLQNYNSIPSAIRCAGGGPQPQQQNVMLNQFMMGVFQGLGQALGDAAADDAGVITDSGVDSGVGGLDFGGSGGTDLGGF